MKLQFVEAGEIVTTHGVKGEVKVLPWLDSPEDLCDFDRCRIGGKEFEIEQVRFSKNMVFIKLKGIDTIEEAENYRNFYLKIKRDKYEKLEEGSYYIVDIIGCKVYTDTQEELGEVDDVFSTGSNDVYVVKDELGKQILLPAIKEVIKNVDIENKIITVHLYY